MSKKKAEETKEKSVEELLAQNIPLTNMLNKISFFGLSVTTMYTANTLAMNKLEVVLGNWAYLAPFLSVCAAFFVMWMFDFDLRKQFIYSLQTIFAKGFKSAKTSFKGIAYLIVFLVSVRLLLSGFATFVSATFISDDMVKDVDTEQVEKMLQEKENTKQEIAINLTSQIKDIRKDANKRADQLVSTAIESYGSRNAKLWRQNNSWIKTATKDRDGNKMTKLIAWRKRIAKAEGKAEVIRKDASSQIAALQTSQTNIIEAETKDTVFASITAIKARQIAKAENKEWYAQISFWVFDIVFSFFCIITSICLVMIGKFKPEYKLFSEETSLLELGNKLLGTVKAYAYSMAAVAIGWLDKKAEHKISTYGQDGTIQLNAKVLAIARPQNDNNDVHNPVHKKPKNVHNSANKNAHKSVHNSKHKGSQGSGTQLKADNLPTKNANKTVHVLTKDDGKMYVEVNYKDGRKFVYSERKIRNYISTYTLRHEKAKEGGKHNTAKSNSFKVDMFLGYLAKIEAEKINV